MLRLSILGEHSIYIRTQNTCTAHLTYIYLLTMHLTFDPVKDAANVAKHGISLSAAADLDWANALTESDDRHDTAKTE